MKKKVYIGLSGGVDSAVSAYLLKKAGYDVIGVFIKVWQPEFIPCTWKEDRLDAMRVAAKLNIPFETLDLEEEYKKEVIDYMLSEYKCGRTPNPDVFCNKYIKFGGFLDYAKKMGADCVATGHYADVRESVKKKDGSPYFYLFRGSDPQKDQSYFLWTLNQNQLSNIIFPLGKIKKTEVREIAKNIDLPNMNKKDSQGLCFVSNVNMKEFLSEFYRPFPGIVLSEEGEEIGTHSGAIFYTIGERHGFRINGSDSKQKEIYYVISKDLDKNTITVSPKSEMDNVKTSSNVIRIKDTNWINECAPIGRNLEANIVYHGKNIPCQLKDSNEVIFNENILIASGQSVVFYEGSRCLGGGIAE